MLYGKKYDSAFLRDLLKIKAYYKLWLNQEKKNDDASDPYRMGLLNNGMLYMISIIGAVCKIYYHDDYAQSIANSVMTEQKMEIISQHDIDHGFLNPEMDEKKKVFELFEFCYVRFYRQGYEFLKTFKEKYNNYSNFTKVNSNYASYVFKQIAFEFRNGISGTDKEFLDSVLYHASEEEIGRDRILLEKYVNVVFVDLNAESSIPDEKIAEIKEALIEYRTKAYKLNRVKAYEVFKNVAADDMIFLHHKQASIGSFKISVQFIYVSKAYVASVLHSIVQVRVEGFFHHRMSTCIYLCCKVAE